MKKPTSHPTNILLPFPRDNNFVGREDVFDQVEASLRHTKYAALVGLGGMGKSQIAIEYAYRCKEKDPRVMVFWVRASRHDRLQKSFQDIADMAGLSRRDDPTVNKVELVYDWLYYQQHDPWLLIYDDVDQDVFSCRGDEYFHLQSRPDTPCMSQPSNGSILITSKDGNTCARLAGNTSCLINIDSLTEAEALELLKTTLPSDTSSLESLDELARELDYIPLALSQAVSYMGCRLSISDYLLMLRTSEMIRILFLDYEFSDPRREDHPSNSILKNLWVSFEKVCCIAPSAMGLLSLFSVYDHRSIPSRLITGSEERDHAMRTLLDFSIIKRCPRSAEFTMHSIVQLSVQEWFKLNGFIHAQSEDVARSFCGNPDHIAGYDDWSPGVLYPLMATAVSHE